jgi:hypothetical protein
MNGPVYALAVSGGTLYAGGLFTNAGGASANYIAQWNGSSWSALGSGISGADADYAGPCVLALAISGNTLYVGGDFMAAGAVTNANCIAQWNGSSWSALGSGMNGAVGALAVSGGILYAGGDFDFTADYAVEANAVAQWNGSSWSALGSGMGGGGPPYTYVYALEVSGGTLYAGGSFTNAGGTAANYIAQWNGSNWSPLGSGMNGGVSALAVSGGTLYAGGNFTTAGTNASGYVAGGILAPMIGSFNPSTGQLDMANLIPGQSCVVQTSTDLVHWVCMQTNTVCTACQTLQLPVNPQASAGFYRLMVLP